MQVAIGKASMQSPKEELSSFAHHYFTSVDDVFQQTVKQLKYGPRFFALGFSFLLISFGAIIVSVVFILDVSPTSNVFSIVLFGTMFTYVPSIIWILLTLDDKRMRGMLHGEKLAFCHIYNALRELKAYLTNERFVHLKKAESNFASYLEHSEINFELEVEEMRAAEMGGSTTIKKSTNVGNLVQQLSADFWWFDLQEKADSVVNAYQQLASKIVRRLRQGAEADKLVPFLTNLMLYEYSKIRKTSVEELGTSQDHTVSELGRICLIDFASAIGEPDELKKQGNQTEGDLKARLKSASATISEAFMSEKILVAFSIWYILLIVVFGLSLWIVTKFASVTWDSTLMVGLFTAPFAGAIVISTAIFAKSKK